MKKTAKLFLSCISILALCSCGRGEDSTSSSGHKTSVNYTSYDIGDSESKPNSSKPNSSVKPSSEEEISSTVSSSDPISSSSSADPTYHFKDDYAPVFQGTLNTESDTITGFEDGVTPLNGNAAFSSLTNKEEGLTVGYSYDDSLFFSEATRFSLPLQKMSYALSLASLPSGGEDSNANVASLLSDIGFSNPSYQAASDTDSGTIGSYFATKWVEKDGVSYPVVAVIPTTTDAVDATAVLDLKIGTSGDYEGLISCSDTLQSRLETYLGTLGTTQNPLDYSKVKLWLSGYSVSGAVSNVLGGRINTAISNAVSGTKTGVAALSIENVYDYTFATLCGIDASTKAALSEQHNIFNTILDTDFMPHFAFNSSEAYVGSGWNFARYGYDYVIDTSSVSLQQKVETKFLSYDMPEGYNYVPASSVPLMNVNLPTSGSSFTSDSLTDIITKVDPEQDISITGLYHNLITALTDSTTGNGAGLTRDKSAKLYGILKDGVDFYDGLTPEERTALVNATKDAIKAPTFATTFTLMLKEIKKANKNPETVTIKPALEYPATYAFIISILKKANLDTAENEALVKKDLPYLMWTLNGFDQMLEGDNGVLLTTFIGNETSTLSCHYPEAMLAWNEVMAEEAGVAE